ncbi:hypothetical protein PR048_027223 [Dryococelus australis]|uniref:HAT C-terminal dimerisation domain-containing protein n=1 Tax=Dryococelus australis TaxID=614101 RepID=A0ABQ9GET9_9NEOP|nr:hypothetical protein PR048_027223 [Dryococelus australis]
MNLFKTNTHGRTLPSTCSKRLVEKTHCNNNHSTMKVQFNKKKLLIDIVKFHSRNSSQKMLARRPLWTICAQRMSDSSDQHGPAQHTLSENESTLTHYLNEPILPITADIFQYWYHPPHLKFKTLAKKFLGLPPSTVNSEHLFSVAGNISDKKRNRLYPQTLQKFSYRNQFSSELAHLYPALAVLRWGEVGHRVRLSVGQHAGKHATLLLSAPVHPTGNFAPQTS